MWGNLGKICRTTPLLPVLVGVLTVVSMFAANAEHLGWGQLWAPLLFVILWSLVCWFLLWLVPRGRSIVVVLASITVLVTMLWDLFPQLPQKYIMTTGIPQVVIWLGISVLAVKFHKSVIKAVPIATAIILVAIIVSSGQAAISIASVDNTETSSQGIVETSEDYANIYFIVPDRFGSLDGLRESGLSEGNISWFAQELRDRGFYVREDALSSDTFASTDRAVSTTRTLRYLASVLNFGEELSEDIGFSKASQMVRNPEIIQILHSLGYTCYNVGSWYPETAVCGAADYNYVYKASNPVQWLYVNEFGAAVLDRSIWRYFIVTGNQTERDRQMFQLQSIRDIASDGISPKFVFVHLLLPHPPFVWTADGQPMDGEWEQQNQLSLNLYGDMLRYLQQVQFTESYLLEMVDSIDDNAIIILQSDEGICFTRPSENEGLSNTQWNGVLMAWRIPGQSKCDFENISHTEILSFVVSVVSREEED